MSFDNNKIYISELKKGNFIPFIGSGMSAGFGLIDWKHLLLKAIRLNDDEKTNKECRNLLKCFKYWEVADKLPHRLLSQLVSTEFHSNKVQKRNDEDNYLYYFKQKNIHTIVTTNFDPIIETNINFDNKIFTPSTMTETDSITERIASRNPILIKLHGTYDQYDSIILTKDDFNKKYKKESALYKTLKCLWNYSNILFMGCGLNDNDYLIDKMKELAKKKYNHWHYAILPYPKKADARFSRLVNMGINPIWYELDKDNEQDKHHKIIDILRDILDINDVNLPSNKLTIEMGTKPTMNQTYTPNDFDLKFLDHLAKDVKDNEDLQKKLIAAISMQCNEDALRTYGDGSALELDKMYNYIAKSENKYPLSIEGEPGTGKSTILSLLYYKCLLNSKKDNTQPFLISTNYDLDDQGNRWKTEDTLTDLRQYLEKIEGRLMSDNNKKTILLIDGLTLFMVNDKLETEIRTWINKICTVPKLSIVYSIGKLDQKLYPKLNNKQGEIKAEKIIYFHPVKIDNAEFVNLTLNYYGSFKKIELQDDLKENLCNKIKELGRQYVDFRIILFFIERYYDCEQDRSNFWGYNVGKIFNDYYTKTLNNLGRAAEYIAKTLLADSTSSEKSEVDEYVKSHCLFKSESITNYFLAYYYISILQENKSGDLIKKLKLFNCILTVGINKFAVYLMNNLKDERGESIVGTIINNIKSLMIKRKDEKKTLHEKIDKFKDYLINNLQHEQEKECIEKAVTSIKDTMNKELDNRITLHQKIQLAFMLGRVKKREEDEDVINILKREYREYIGYLRKEMYMEQKLDYDIGVYIRTIGISLIFLGDVSYENDFYKELIYNGYLNQINRNFHIRYFTTDGYKFDEEFMLDNTMCTSENIDPLYKFLKDSIYNIQSKAKSKTTYSSRFRFSSEEKLLNINVITVLNLIFYKLFCLPEISKDEEIEEAKELIEKILELDDYLESNVRNRVCDIKNLLNKNIYIEKLKNIYELKENMRSKWIEKYFGKHTVFTDHTWGCCQLALFFLPENNKFCRFQPVENYDLSRIILMLLVQDYLPKNKKIKLEDLQELNRLPHFCNFNFINALVLELNGLTTCNSKIAHDINAIEPLLQIFIYRDRMSKNFDDEMNIWRKNHSMRSNFGKNLLTFFVDQFKEDQRKSEESS
ncbi:SIR2 family protein [bacterium]|nr:SIR2 family protein [bacterium]